MFSIATLFGVLAQAKPKGEAQAPNFLVPLVIFLPFILMYYLLVLRPQKKRMKQREAMISSLTKGSRVLTVGGIHGIVKNIRDEDITLVVDEQKDVRIKVSRSAISQVIAAGSKDE